MIGNRKSTLIVLFVGFIVSLLIFRLLVSLLNPPHQPQGADLLVTTRPFCYGFAGLTLLFSIGWTLLRVRTASTWGQFQTYVILSLASSEICSLMGLLLFMIGGAAGEFNGFMIASIATDILVILPFILLY